MWPIRRQREDDPTSPQMASVPPLTLLVDSITQLQLGILTNLMMSYRSRFAPSDVTALAASVLSEAILEGSY